MTAVVLDDATKYNLGILPCKKLRFIPSSQHTCRGGCREEGSSFDRRSRLFREWGSCNICASRLVLDFEQSILVLDLRSTSSA